MIKNIKKILIAILIICISLILPNNVYAGEFTLETNTDGNDSGTTDSTGTPTGLPKGPGSLSCGNSSSGWTATCKVKTSSKEKNTYGVFAWDMNGNNLGNIYDNKIDVNLEKIRGILAGTYVKLQIYEKKTVTIEAKVISTGIQEYHTCAKWTSYTCKKKVTNEDGTQVWKESTCYHWTNEHNVKGTKCPSGYASRATYYEYTDSCNSARLQCRDSKPPSMPNVSPSVTLNLSDSNDAKNNGSSLSVEGKEVSSSIIDEKGNWYWKKGVTKTFSYSIEKICINVKNGKVKYVKKTDECDKNNEYEIAAEDEKWKYFIPLNAKSKEGFSISLKPISGSGKMTPGLCIDAMKKMPYNYRKFIKSAGEEFTGIYEEDKNKVSKGCYLALNIIVPVTQKFYNEQEDNTFKGFNFYYKPIDINNPFPNGIPNNSIWTEKETKKLTGTSFNKDDITYIADVTNANAIRDYKNQETNHKKNLYTSWENMHINGVSDFIENGGFIKRNVSKTDFYKLGCGPENEKRTNSDGTTNYLYQQECGTR